MSSRESMNYDIIDEINNRSEKEIVFVPENLRERLSNSTDFEGKPIYTFDNFIQERSANFEFKFINPNQLTEKELVVFNKTNQIIDLIGGKPSSVKEIKISETMQEDSWTFAPANGLWQSKNGRIIIKRSALNNLEEYAGVLIHELSHAKSERNGDLTREFEMELTNIIGLLASKILK